MFDDDADEGFVVRGRGGGFGFSAHVDVGGLEGVEVDDDVEGREIDAGAGVHFCYVGG